MVNSVQMPPQGEALGIAVEDGILLGRVFERRDSRPIAQLFADYELLRRTAIDAKYKASIVYFNNVTRTASWLWIFVREWLMYFALLLARWKKQDHLIGDVRKLELPQ
jgi:2-polyprenyl-6-methoxyphenol hydroxylase-like FAD-dependent oxidoreductase